MIYGTYNELVFMGVINHNWAPHCTYHSHPLSDLAPR